MKDFRKLKVWEKVHQLVLKIYRVTGTFPAEETYGLTSQIRRAAVSVPTNIAEGCGRDSDSELARFMVIGMGSASEVQYLLLLANDLEMITPSEYSVLADGIVEIKQMLSTFIKRVRQKADV